jgi:hypothetical protein
MSVPNLLFIPEGLKSIPHWVNWKWEQRADRTTGELKWTKPPYQPNGQLAESDNPETWITFELAVAAYEKGNFSGIGFVLTKDDGFAGVDLDHCRDPETGVIEPWAMNVVQRLNSYTEISPSGTGLRIFLRATLPPKDRKIGHFECYSSGRYLTVTGNHVDGTPTTVEHRQAEMEAVHAEMFAERNKPRSTGKASTPPILPDLDDQDLLDKAFRAKNGESIWRLFHGDISGYQSHSEADLALCGLLAFYTGPDHEKLDRIYRSSDLVSPKWDEPRGGSTWGEMTMNKALEGKTEFYSANGQHINGGYPDHSLPTAEDQPWPDLGELPQLASPPTLPADMVPECLRPWVESIARQGCFPLEMVAAPALVGVSAVIGRRLAIRPWLFSDYTVVPNLWGCVVARPASMKSNAIDQAIKPLKRLAATARERFQAGVIADAAHVMALEAEVDGLKTQMRQAAKKGASVGDLEVKVARKLQELEINRTVERRYWVSDSTPEKLADLLRENPTGLLVSYDELAGWLGDMEKQGREGSRAFYLAAWEGTGDHYVDRVQRGTNYIPSVCLSVIGGIQPDRLRLHIDEAISGGSGGDGMLQRFQLMICIDDLGEWKAPDAWPASGARETAYRAFQVLDELDLVALGTQVEDEIPYVRFSPDAQARADQWRDELEDKLRGIELKEMPAFEAHLGKYRSLMPSLALIFHLLSTCATSDTSFSKEYQEKNFEVSLDAVEMALDWCDFLELHARRVYEAELSPGTDAAGRLAKKILDQRIVHGVSVRDIYQHHWSGLTTSGDVSSGLEVLEFVGWVRVVSQPTAGAPISIVHLHPGLRGGKDG